MCLNSFRTSLVHSKVTRYILQQVDIQLEKLGESCNTDNVRTMDHNIATQTCCSKQNTCNEAATQTTENDNRVNLNAVNDENHIINHPVIPVPTNTQIVQSLSGPPIHYIPMSISETTCQQLCNTKSDCKFKDTLERCF